MSENTNNGYEEIDFNKIELIRGLTPQDIQECHQLCREYLAGAWLHITSNQVVLKRVGTGFTNQMYLCSLPDGTNTISDEPREVVIRIYDTRFFNNLDTEGDERLADIIIALIVSQFNLGPKIYGIFPTGQIQKFYKHKNFRVEQQNDDSLVSELARKLARIHSLDIPIKKTGNRVFETFEDHYKKAYERFPINELIEQMNLFTFKKYDLKSEIDWLKSCVVATNSPIVFCHNDFRGSNIMVNDDPENSDPNNRITLCDFEYSSYSYRGVDLGSIFDEWGQIFNDFENLHNFPDDQIVEKFLNHYIDENAIIHGAKFNDDKTNSMKQLLMEAKVFTLVSNLFMVTLCLQFNEVIDNYKFNKRQQMNWAEFFFKNYIHLKEKFNKDNVFPCI